jgi:hypothetical protein
MEIVKKTLAIINELNPKYFFIENPRAMLRKQPFMTMPRKTVTYCKYGLPYQKATDIWTNCLTWTPKTPCSANDPCRVRAPRGSRYGIQGVKQYSDDGKRLFGRPDETRNAEHKVWVDTPVHYGWWKLNKDQPISHHAYLHPEQPGDDKKNAEVLTCPSRIARAIVPRELCEEIIKACES